MQGGVVTVSQPAPAYIFLMTISQPAKAGHFLGWVFHNPCGKLVSLTTKLIQ